MSDFGWESYYCVSRLRKAINGENIKTLKRKANQRNKSPEEEGGSRNNSLSINITNSSSPYLGSYRDNSVCEATLPTLGNRDLGSLRGVLMLCSKAPA